MNTHTHIHTLRIILTWDIEICAYINILLVYILYLICNCIGGVNVSVLVSSTVDRGFVCIGGVNVSVLVSSTVDRGFVPNQRLCN